MKIFIFLDLFLINFSQYYIVRANPVIGHNILNAGENEFPFIVSIARVNPTNPETETDHICSGSLITRRDVATAEHCVLNHEITTILVLVGSNNLRRCRRHYILWWTTYVQWVTHRKLYQQFAYNDIATIRLIISVHRSIEPVSIPNLPNQSLYGERVVTAGWGWLNITQMSPLLKKIELVVLRHDRCIERMSALAGEPVPLHRKHALCTASNPYSLITYGDSGSPLLYHNQLVGINKGACPNNVSPDNPELVNLHMSVHFYRRFFLETIKLERSLN